MAVLLRGVVENVLTTCVLGGLGGGEQGSNSWQRSKFNSTCVIKCYMLLDDCVRRLESIRYIVAFTDLKWKTFGCGKYEMKFVIIID